MKKALFIDRDGTLIVEPPEDFQVDSLEKLEFYPRVFRNIYNIRKNLDFELVIVSNQDGMGTDSFPEPDFLLPQNKMLKAFKNEDIEFDDILIDPSFPHENKPTRKPGTGMFGKYLDGNYDIKNSYVIGDRVTDIQLAQNLGCKAIFMNIDISKDEIKKFGLDEVMVLQTTSWEEIAAFLLSGKRIASVRRTTKETDIHIEVNLDGSGKSEISTGLGFFDHMLDQIARHAGTDLIIKVNGDLHVDEHHTIEDTALALGECFIKAMGDKRGMERYGFVLPMDDCLAQVAIDFGGRSWLVWETEFKREKVGEMPTEMFYHFFKSFSDASKSNINIKAEGNNEHHKIEAIFKALARAIKMAIRRDVFNNQLPTTKGML